MQTRHVAHLVFLATVTSGIACGSSAVDAKSAHDAGQGTVRVFDGTPQELWDAGHAAVKWNPVGPIVDHGTDYFVTDPTDFDQIGMWVEPAGPGRTRVTVVVIDDPTLPGPNEQGIIKDVATALALARNGQSTEKRP